MLNKIDRLKTEMQLTAADAYKHLFNLLVRINAIAGELFLSEALEMDDVQANAASRRDILQERLSTSEPEDFDWDRIDETMYFEPSLETVIFASAMDGWGFTVADFVKLYSEKTGIKSEVLTKTLWGDYFIDAKSKRIRLGAFEKGKKTIFETLVLDSIWKVYDAILVANDKEKVIKMAKTLNVDLAARDLKHQDPKVFFKNVLFFGELLSYFFFSYGIFMDFRFQGPAARNDE